MSPIGITGTSVLQGGEDVSSHNCAPWPSGWRRRPGRTGNWTEFFITNFRM